MSERESRWKEIANTRERIEESERRNAEIDDLHVLVFGTQHGQRLLDFYYSVTLERVLPMDASEGALRELEANRRFVAEIGNRIARARARKQQAAKSGGRGNKSER